MKSYSKILCHICYEEFDLYPLSSSNYCTMCELGICHVCGKFFQQIHATVYNSIFVIDVHSRKIQEEEGLGWRKNGR